jgi:predicted secreted acid phosphatase
MARKLLLPVVATISLMLLAPTPVSPMAIAAETSVAVQLPSKSQWRRDVRRAMAGSGKFLHARLERAEPGERLAINFDIDNTTLATHYNRGEPVRRVLRFAKHAQRHGVYILFNTGRSQEKLADTPARLAGAGYLVAEICTRPAGVKLVKGKKQCRRHFREEGYTIIANVGNRRTDFVGRNYGRAFKLPSYHNRLG